MPTLTTRRRWIVCSAALVASAATPLSADPPNQTLRIASSSLPVPSRSRRLDDRVDTHVVITAIAVDPRKEIVVAAGDDYRIRILSAADLSVLKTVAAHQDVIRTLSFTIDGARLVSAGNDGQLVFWDRDNDFRIMRRMTSTPALACARFAPLGDQLAVAGFNDTVYLIGGADDGSRLRCDCSDLRALAYRDDMRILAAAGRSGSLHLFDLQTGQLNGDFHVHRGRISSIAFHRNSPRLVSAGEDGRVTVFDTEDQELVREIPVTTGKLFSIAILNSQYVAVAGSDNLIRIVNTEQGHVVRVLEGHVGSIRSLAAVDGVLFSGSFDATIRRWTIGDLTLSRQRIAEGDPGIDR